MRLPTNPQNPEAGFIAGRNETIYDYLGLLSNWILKSLKLLLLLICCSEMVDLLKIICAIRLPVRIHKLDQGPRAVIALCGFWFCAAEKRLINSLTK